MLPRVVRGGREPRAPDDALEWFTDLVKLPPPPEIGLPKREALIELFDKVRFHPLSIQVLAQQMKTRRPAELGRRLEAQVGVPGMNGSGRSCPLYGRTMAEVRSSFRA